MTELETLLRQQWTKHDSSIDEAMVNYCLKSSKYIDVGEYYIDVGDSKPKIESTMWYDDEYTSPDDSKFEVFREYNMRGKRLSLEEEAEDGYTKIWVYNQYGNDRAGGKLKGWTATRHTQEPSHLGECREATPDDIAAIKQGLAEIKADYEKRLKIYWKRYSNKVHASGYYANR